MAAAPAVTSVVNYAAMRELAFPVSGAGSNIPFGTLMAPGASAGVNFGVLIPYGTGANTGAIGVLNSPHNFAASGDATTATLVQWFGVPSFESNSYLLGNKLTGTGGPFPSHGLDLFDTMVAVKISYSQVSTVAVASASTTVLTITSETANQDSMFAYVNAGTGLGQLGFMKSTASGSETLTSALTTTLDSTSKLTKILPLFLQTVIWKVNSTTAPTYLDSVAGVGTGRASILANFINLNGVSSRLDPKVFHNMQNLNLVPQLDFYSYVGILDTSFHPIA